MNRHPLHMPAVAHACDASSAEAEAQSLAGTVVCKSFFGVPFYGIITLRDPDTREWWVQYDDGDEEELSADEVAQLAVSGPEHLARRTAALRTLAVFRPRGTRSAYAQLAVAEVKRWATELGRERAAASAATHPAPPAEAQAESGRVPEDSLHFAVKACRTVVRFKARCGTPFAKVLRALFRNQLRHAQMKHLHSCVVCDAGGGVVTLVLRARVGLLSCHELGIATGSQVTLLFLHAANDPRPIFASTGPA
jgi:uncharacterized protein YqiB (DUF1249 family)